MDSSSSSSSSSSSASSFHLAMAALVGASLMAISAFYIHKRSVDQVLDRLIELRKTSPKSTMRVQRLQNVDESQEEDVDFDQQDKDANDEEDDDEGGFDLEDDRRLWNQRLSTYLDGDRSYGFPISSSLPNEALENHWTDGEAKADHPMQFVRPSFGNFNSIQPAQGDGSNQSLDHSCYRTRSELVPRPSTPKSPDGIAFERIDNSEVDGTLILYEEGSSVIHNNGNSFLSDNMSMQIHDAYANIHDPTFVSHDVQNADFARDKNSGAMSRSMNGKAGLHDNQKEDTGHTHHSKKDVIDIVMPLKTMPHERPNGEEEEVCMMLRECLALRDKYVYRENVAPWMKEAVTESSPQILKNDPFYFDPIEQTQHFFRMEDGVIHVYANKDGETCNFFIHESEASFAFHKVKTEKGTR